MSSSDESTPDDSTEPHQKDCTLPINSSEDTTPSITDPTLYLKAISSLWLYIINTRDFSFTSPPARLLKFHLCPSIIARIDASTQRYSATSLTEFRAQEISSNQLQRLEMNSVSVYFKNQELNATVYMDMDLEYGVGMRTRAMCLLRWSRMKEDGRWMMQSGEAMRGLWMNRGFG